MHPVTIPGACSPGTPGYRDRGIADMVRDAIRRALLPDIARLERADGGRPTPGQHGSDLIMPVAPPMAASLAVSLSGAAGGSVTMHGAMDGSTVSGASTGSTATATVASGG